MQVVPCIINYMYIASCHLDVKHGMDSTRKTSLPLKLALRRVTFSCGVIAAGIINVTIRVCYVCFYSLLGQPAKGFSLQLT